MLCTVGMTIGMAIDMRGTPLLLMRMCTTDRGWTASVVQHVSAMPAMYIGVTLAIAIGLVQDVDSGRGTARSRHRLAGSLTCAALMLIGMILPCLLLTRTSPWLDPVTAWLAMSLGMLAGHGVHALGQAVLRRR